jgi:aminoglycoside phosphotransferase (APT) family kinase protein
MASEMKIDQQILPYLQANAREVLGVSDFTGAAVEKFEGGDYNYNYHVQQGECNVVVRLNIESQSGSADHIVDEYRALEFVAPHDIAPKPLFLDNTREHFPYGLLIEEYIAGGHIQFSIPAVQRAAIAMSKLHMVPIENAPLQQRENPLRGQYASGMAALEWYEQRQNPDMDLLRLCRHIMAKMVKNIPKLEGLYAPRSVVHADPNPANIIDNGKSIHFIDWERSRIDDPSQDVAAFICDAQNLWASPRALTDTEKQAFLKTYMEKTGDTTMSDRIPPRLLLYTLGTVLWGADRIADVDEGTINPHLGDQNYSRYQKLADPKILEKALEIY